MTHFKTCLFAGLMSATAIAAAGSAAVSMNQFVSGGVPDLASWALMLTGSLGMASLLRRNRRRPAPVTI